MRRAFATYLRASEEYTKRRVLRNCITFEVSSFVNVWSEWGGAVISNDSLLRRRLTAARDFNGEVSRNPAAQRSDVDDGLVVWRKEDDVQYL